MSSDTEAGTGGSAGGRLGCQDLKGGRAPTHVAARALHRCQPYEVVTATVSHGKLVSERSQSGSVRGAFHAARAVSTTAS